DLRSCESWGSISYIGRDACPPCASRPIFMPRDDRVPWSGSARFVPIAPPLSSGKLAPCAAGRVVRWRAAGSRGQITPSALFARPPAAQRRSGVQGPDGLAAASEDTTDEAASGRTRARAVADAAQEWRDRLVALSGASALSDVSLLGEAVIDLTAAHPSGIA